MKMKMKTMKKKKSKEAKPANKKDAMTGGNSARKKRKSVDRSKVVLLFPFCM
jgi:hypothetical protein